jgi:hypothetical protein
VTGAASDAGAAAERKLAAAHQALLNTPGLQFDFKAVAAPRPPPPWLEALFKALESAAPVLKYVFWGGLILGVALVAWFVLREFAGFRLGGTRSAKDFAGAGLKPEPERARALLEEADRLAAEGRFDEAIHVLLFRSIDDIAGRKPGAVRPALTSRDIARLDAMPGEARSAFTRIAEAVERSFFGGRAADAEAFGRCRADYEAFAFSEAWR